MAFCGKCGTQITEDAKFCPSCGAKIEAAEPVPAPAPAPQTEPEPHAEQPDVMAKLQALNDTVDTTAEFDPADIEKNKLMAILAYLSWLVLVPIFAAKDSKFARFHANQGLVLAITEIAWWIISAVVGSILSAIKLGFLASLLDLVGLVFLLMLVLGILNAANGKAKELPVIGKFKILK